MNLNVNLSYHVSEQTQCVLTILFYYIIILCGSFLIGIKHFCKVTTSGLETTCL